MARLIRRKEAKHTLPGAKWRETHQQAVNSLLGTPGSPNYRKVHSKGSSFFNVDSWPLRVFLVQLTEWAKLNPGATPTEYDVRMWVDFANSRCLPDWQEPHIVVMMTPEEVEKWLALAITGGDYHEAFHTLYSRRERLRYDEVVDGVLEMWSKVEYAPEKGLHGWAGLCKPLLEWSNLIEDVYIERRGCREYPGTAVSLPHLQDLILKMEGAGQVVSEHKRASTNDALRVISCGFRDLGLGYDTVTQAGAYKTYQSLSPEGWEFVTKGPLKPILDKTIALADHNPGALGSLWLAMEAMAEIVKLVSKKAEEDDGLDEGGQGGGSGGERIYQPDKGEERDPDSGNGNTRKCWMVGDVVAIRKGEHRGKKAEVTWVSVPDAEGNQEVEVRLVGED